MDALEYLKNYYRTNPTAAAILSGAIACFAAVTVIGKFGIDLQASIPSVFYALGIGIVFYLVVRLLDEPASRRAASWFFLLLVAAWVIAFFWSRLHPKDPELQCAVYFWAPCGQTADDVATDTAPKPQVVQAAPNPTSGGLSSDAKAQFQVFIQFAGFTRDTIIGVASTLGSQGWKVQGADRGGERTSNAAGYTEVRYHDAAARPAAEALAAALNATKITSKQVKAKQLDIIKPDTLEIWISL